MSLPRLPGREGAPLGASPQPNVLRHSFATHLFDNGADLPVVQRLLGHEDPRDTMIYLHLSTRTLRVAPNPLDTLPPKDSASS